jgi:ATP-dependent helicase/DNAse subunit B
LNHIKMQPMVHLISLFRCHMSTQLIGTLNRYSISLKAWLEAEMVADVWVDAYQVMRDNDKLNNGLEYLLTFKDSNKTTLV